MKADFGVKRGASKKGAMGHDGECNGQATDRVRRDATPAETLGNDRPRPVPGKPAALGRLPQTDCTVRVNRRQRPIVVRGDQAVIAHPLGNIERLL